MREAHRRRDLLRAGGLLAGVGVAGCVGRRPTAGAGAGDDAGALAPADGPATPLDVRASFVVVGHVAAAVGDERASVETLVPVGQHGHGFEPGPGVSRAVLDADVFVHAGPGFQPWADRLARLAAADEAPVRVVDARADVTPRRIDGGDGHDHGGEHEDGDGHDDHDDHDDHDEHEGDEGHEDGGDDDHEDEGGEEHGEHDGATYDAHRAGGVDPHFWLDPSLAAVAVDTVRDAFVDLDPAGEPVYDAGARRLRDRLAALDAAFEAGLAGRTRDVVVLAGHGSFGYLAARYGFEVVALAGLAPDESPTPRVLARAAAAVDEHEVEYVLAPVFESDRGARALVEATEARAVLPVTSVPSLTEEWVTRGWDFVDVLREVTLPALARALGAA